MEEKELDLELARTVLEQGEKRLSAQLQIAIAMDQKALVFAGMMLGIATLLIGIGVGFLGKESMNLPVGLSAIITGIINVIAAAICSKAAMPSKYFLPGARPKDWWEDGVESRPLAECYRKESDNYQYYIEFNAECHKQSGKLIRLASWIGCFSPIVGVIIWYITWVLVAKAAV